MGMFDGKSRTVAEFLKALPEPKREEAHEALALIRKSMPKGYQEQMSLGMVTWSVPLTVLPDTYNKQALWYVALAATKAGFSLYLMSAYGNTDERKKLEAGFKKAGKKLDMAQACVRFKAMDDIAIPAVKASIKAMPMKKYVEAYRAIRAKTKKGK